MLAPLTILMRANGFQTQRNRERVRTDIVIKRRMKNYNLWPNLTKQILPERSVAKFVIFCKTLLKMNQI